ncbi:hypothetical protein B0H16DRAFT_1535699, partial [Mycena metata]
MQDFLPSWPSYLLPWPLITVISRAISTTGLIWNGGSGTLKTVSSCGRTQNCGGRARIRAFRRRFFPDWKEN